MMSLPYYYYWFSVLKTQFNSIHTIIRIFEKKFSSSWTKNEPPYFLVSNSEYNIIRNRFFRVFFSFILFSSNFYLLLCFIAGCRGSFVKFLVRFALLRQLEDAHKEPGPWWAVGCWCIHWRPPRCSPPAGGRCRGGRPCWPASRPARAGSRLSRNRMSSSSRSRCGAVHRGPLARPPASPRPARWSHSCNRRFVQIHTCRCRTITNKNTITGLH